VVESSWSFAAGNRESGGRLTVKAFLTERFLSRLSTTPVTFSLGNRVSRTQAVRPTGKHGGQPASANRPSFGVVATWHEDFREDLARIEFANAG